MALSDGEEVSKVTQLVPDTAVLSAIYLNVLALLRKHGFPVLRVKGQHLLGISIFTFAGYQKEELWTLEHSALRALRSQNSV